MPFDAVTYQNMIVLELGDPPTGPVATNIQTIWDFESKHPTLGLQYLYAKVKAIDVLLGPAARKSRLTANRQSIDDTLFYQHLMEMRKMTWDEIQREELLLAAPATGQITQTGPVMPPQAPYEVPGPLDANDSRYRGDPYKPTGGYTRYPPYP